MGARKYLRDAYRSDVEEIAAEVVARLPQNTRFAEWMLLDLTHCLVRDHPRVREEALALETIVYSENRDAVTTDYVAGWSVEFGGPWGTYIGPIDLETGRQGEVTLPSWASIAFHALLRDVEEVLRARLGGTCNPEGPLSD